MFKQFDILLVPFYVCYIFYMFKAKLDLLDQTVYFRGFLQNQV